MFLSILSAVYMVNFPLMVSSGITISSRCGSWILKVFSMCISERIEYDTPCPRRLIMLIISVLLVRVLMTLGNNKLFNILTLLPFRLETISWAIEYFIVAFQLLSATSFFPPSKLVRNSFRYGSMLNFSGSRLVGWGGQGNSSFKSLTSF